MSEDTIIELQTPPLPYYWESGRSDFQAGDRHPNRRNLGLFDLLIVAEGELHIGENGREWTLGLGDTLLLMPDGEHYSVKPCESRTTFYWVHFEHSAWQQGARFPRAEGSVVNSPFANPHAIRVPKQIALPAPDIAFDVMRQLLELPVGDSFWQEQSLLAQLLALLEKARSGDNGKPGNRLAERAAAYIQHHYREDITNETLAEALHFHPNYIVRSMKKKYGATPSHYLLEFRLERAKRLLLSTEWPIERIADEVGFRYAPYFSACFKRKLGVSPLRYRKQFNGEWT
jgi:AraC-type DNA-binding domain-containing proteins